MILPRSAPIQAGLTFVVLCGLAPGAGAQDAPMPFRAGMVVTQSLTIRPGRYFAPAGHSGAIVVRGDDIVLTSAASSSSDRTPRTCRTGSWAPRSASTAAGT